MRMATFWLPWLACLIIQLHTNSACSIPRRIFLTRLCSENRAWETELDISILIFNTRNWTQFPNVVNIYTVWCRQLLAIYLVGNPRLNRTALSVDVIHRCQQIKQRFAGSMWCLVLPFWYRPVETMCSNIWIICSQFTSFALTLNFYIFLCNGRILCFLSVHNIFISNFENMEIPCEYQAS